MGVTEGYLEGLYKELYKSELERSDKLDAQVNLPYSYGRDFVGSTVMNYLHSEFDLDAGDVVVVDLDAQANVLLMDWSNFEAYKDGRSYRYYGGLAEKSPVRLAAPRRGHWHLVVDLGGYAGKVKAGVRVERLGQGAAR